MITLASDFRWPYPAAMRGVLASRSRARLIDVTHQLPRQDVRAAAFWLREVLPYFPPAVHLVVVDPGVGTDRAVLAIAAGEHRLVGPDNGVLLPAARAIDPDVTVWELERYDAASSTFHGRDVFAPLAARIHEAPEWNCDAVDGLVATTEFDTVSFPDPDVRENEISGEVLVVDGFGNVITNVPGEHVRPAMGGTLRINGSAVPCEPAYAYVAAGDPLATIGSHGNLELAVNGGRGDRYFGVTQGDRVDVERRQ